MGSVNHLLAGWFAETIPSTLKMEAICSSETSGETQRTTWRYIPEDDTIQGNERSDSIESWDFLINGVNVNSSGRICLQEVILLVSCCVTMWTGFICLREYSWAVVSRVMNIREFHKRNLEIFSLAVRVLDSEEGIFSMEFVSVAHLT
jgi:hypothetical protein